MHKLLPALLAIGCLTATAAPTTSAELHISNEKYKLPNGLRVVMARDTSVPVVAVYMVYDVGARAEEKGRTGFAHLFEHMMFEGSANVKKGEHFRYIQSNGGVMNGSTHPDYTDYYETLPSNKLGLALWLESDRMRSLAITPENLKNQQEAVKQERRLSFDNQPYRTAIVERLPPLIYGNFQSSHSLIGSFDDLNAASVDDVAKFFKTYYAPNNAVLVIAGDFGVADAKKLVQDYFGDIPSQPRPPRPDMTEPARDSGKTETVPDPHARVPGFVAAWPAPARSTTDWYALNMMDALLTSGQSSRIVLHLVKGKQSVLQMEANLGWPFESPRDFRDPGVYAMFCLYKPNFTGQQVADQLQDEIDALAKQPVDASELERVRAVIRFEAANSLQSAFSRAQMLGISELYDGDPDSYANTFAKLMAVTPEQIQSAVRKYMSAARRDTMFIQPAAAPPAQKRPQEAPSK